MPSLLLELFSEEIPARMQRGAGEQLVRLVTRGLEKSGLPHGAMRAYVSPRHLAVMVEGLPAHQPDVTEEKKGPRVGAPEQAIQGFLQSTGLTLADCEQRAIGKDTYYFATITRKGRATGEVAKEILEEALQHFVWPKSMRWGAHKMHWVRPLHRILCLLDDAVIPLSFGHLTAGNITEGHRFLAPAPITLPHAKDYVAALQQAKVMVDADARKANIRESLAAAAAQHKLTLREDETLLEEVTGLVEWPVVLLGEFDREFLTLPPEVLISEMKHHQRYFALSGADGKLTNRFLLVANRPTSDGGKAVIAGNSRVLRARLSDGAFYWEQDQKKPLSTWANGLADMVFHAKVGRMDKEVERTRALAIAIAKEIGYQNLTEVARAAELCKADLTTGMVGEFPDLQGIMGRYYANAQGEAKAVVEAIYEHYKPAGAGDSLPATELGAILSVADKLRMMQSLFAAGEKPTGSKDPFALRRAALGALRIVRERQWGIDFASFTPSAELLEFLRERLKNLLRDDGVRHDVIEAGFANEKGGFTPHQLSLETHQLMQWLISDAGVRALAAIKRALNILAAEEKKSPAPFTFSAKDAGILNDKTETELLALLKTISLEKPWDLEALTAPINAFFDTILVNSEDPELRAARLSLLAGVREASMKIADFSKIEG
ncbi:MAG: glycine--tRNA ligase subunit beta [Alphaproteobacteria bacterium]